MVNFGINFYIQATTPQISGSYNELADVPFILL